MNRNKTRSSLLGIAGGYLVYLAYELFRDRNIAETTMTPFARWLFIALFVLFGGGLMVYAFLQWKKADKAGEAEKKNDPDSLK